MLLAILLFGQKSPLFDKQQAAGAATSAQAGSNELGLPVTLDNSPWPIVHGNRASMDQTALKQPFLQSLGIYNTNDMVVDNESTIDSMYCGQLLVRPTNCL